MSVPVELVTLDDYLDAVVRLGLPADTVLRIARRNGFKIRTQDFYASVIERRAQYGRRGRASA